jgi:hypothetical protein
MKTYLAILAILICNLSASGQDSLFNRLTGITIRDMSFYNVDGTEITVQQAAGEFSKKNIVKKFKTYRVRESDLNNSDSALGYTNFYVPRTENIAEGMVQQGSVYFIENAGNLYAVTFTAFNKNDRDFQREFMRLVLKKSIPADVYVREAIDSIPFAGRKIALGSSCQWMGINNVQCPYYGQMNWSVHKDSADAVLAVAGQYEAIKARKNGKIVSDEMKDVAFEGAPVKAQKVVYDFKGLTSVMAGMSGGKTLTIYFVSAPVRGRFVSCVMSFWNNDRVDESGLPPLLGKVMKL